MKRLAPLSVVLCLALVSSAARPARAQQASPGAAAEALPSAREVVERFVEVTKVRPVLERTKSMHQKGRFLMPALGLEGTMEAWSAKPCRRMMVVEMGPGGKVLQGYDGEIAWTTHPMTGPRILKGPELLASRYEAVWDSQLKSSPLIESLQTVGRESFEGKDCYEVQVVLKPLEGMDPEKTRETRTMLEFYEVDSGLLAGVKGKQESEMGGGPYTAVVSDYKAFGDCLLATKTTLKMMGQEFTMTLDSVEYDAAPDEVFALPKEIRAKLQGEAQKTPAKPQ